MTDQEQARALSRRARLGAIVFIIAAIVLMVASVVGTLQLAKARSDLQTDVDELNKDIDSLQKRHASLVADTQSLSRRLKKTLEAVSGTVASSFTDSIDIHASYKVLPDVHTDDGKQVYRFSLWITTTPARLDSIVRVDYRFEHPSFKHPLESSADRHSGFKVHYTGWGSIDPVTVTFVRIDGISLKRAFAMTDELVPE